jgi:hypothetical protein
MKNATMYSYAFMYLKIVRVFIECYRNRNDAAADCLLPADRIEYLN